MQTNHQILYANSATKLTYFIYVEKCKIHLLMTVVIQYKPKRYVPTIKILTISLLIVLIVPLAKTVNESIIYFLIGIISEQ